jgi:hypothetical protein
MCAAIEITLCSSPDLSTDLAVFDHFSRVIAVCNPLREAALFVGERRRRI